VRLCFVALSLKGNNIVVMLTEATSNLETVLVAGFTQAVCSINPPPHPPPPQKKKKKKKKKKI